MTEHESSRQDAPRQQIPLDKQIRAVFSSPALDHLQHVLSPVRGRGTYPDLLLFAVGVAGRVYGSQHRALTHLRQPAVWKNVTDRYCRVLRLNEPLPAVPPSAATQDRFIARLCAQDGALDALLHAFAESAVKMARTMGQFPAVANPDFARLDTRNIIFGDGTWYAPYSKVRRKWDPVTRQHYFLGSRARSGAPRYQVTYTNGRPDNKKYHRGINHVTVSTWTSSGWVVLAVGQALQAEIAAARSLVDQVSDLVGPDVHALVWDRAVTGKDVPHLMANRRILVVNKNVARGSDPHGSHPMPITVDEAKAAYLRGDDLPLGTSVYETERGHDVVKGRFWRYGYLPDVTCRHDLWVDDGALFDVTTDPSGYRFKGTRAITVTSHAVNESIIPETPAWELHTTWDLPCAQTGTTHRFTTVSAPNAKSRSTDHDRALSELRPLPRIDADAFATVHGLRNITESYNAWVKARLGTTADGGRAMRLDARAQLFDHLCAAALANDLTWLRHKAVTRTKH